MSAPTPGDRQQPDERDLIRRARAGSLPAFDQVMRLYEHRVLGFLLRRCASRQDAEDLVQETFLRAWQRLHLYDERWAFSTWLLTVAARLCATHHRRRRDPRAAAPAADLAATDTAPDEAVALREAGQHVWRLADQVLTEEQRIALWLRYADDMPIKDIARVLGRTSVATRVLLFRARAALAAHMPETDAEQDAPADRRPAAAPKAQTPRVLTPQPGEPAALALANNSGAF